MSWACGKVNLHIEGSHSISDRGMARGLFVDIDKMRNDKENSEGELGGSKRGLVWANGKHWLVGSFERGGE
jgi:hypothetical protein